MSESLAQTLLDPLPQSARQDVGVVVFDADGLVFERFGYDDGFTHLDRLEADLAAERRSVSRQRDDGATLVITQPAGADGQWGSLVEALLDSDLLRQRLEMDLESMSMSSLALLEESSMVGEVMAQLSTGETEESVVERGLQSLILGAAAERAFYFRYEPTRDAFELVTHVVYDEGDRRGRVAPYDGDPVVVSSGVLAQADDSLGEAILLQVGDAPLGEPGSPESLARRQVVAAAVKHGQDQAAKLLGVLFLLDKRATSYSNVTNFGSQETKLVCGLASMLAAVLGARKSAELGKEIAMATAIQQQILPDRPVDLDGFDLAGLCQTSGAVGGDYFDFLPMSDGRTMCVVADVSGHNLASGMVMVGARATLRLLTSKQADGAQIFDDLAASMFTDLSQTERFITAAAAVIEAGVRRVELVNAGHNDTMVFRAADRSVERLPSEDTILGFMPGVSYGSQTIELAPGDSIFLYTDGITEAVDVNDEMFGEERLATLLSQCGDGSAQEILDSIYGGVTAFAADNSETDDITAIVIQCVAAGGDA